jgi:hypothetical protein
VHDDSGQGKPFDQESGKDLTQSPARPDHQPQRIAFETVNSRCGLRWEPRLMPHSGHCQPAERFGVGGNANLVSKRRDGTLDAITAIKRNKDRSTPQETGFFRLPCARYLSKSAENGRRSK